MVLNFRVWKENIEGTRYIIQNKKRGINLYRLKKKAKRSNRTIGEPIGYDILVFVDKADYIRNSPF